MSQHLAEMIGLCRLIIRIADSDINSELKYNLIFHKDVAQVIWSNFSLRSYSYYDPDTSYDEDVAAFVDAVRLLLADLKKIQEGSDE